MATESFFKGYEIKDKERVLKVLKVLEEKGKEIKLSPKEKEIFEIQERRGKEKLSEILNYLQEL